MQQALDRNILDRLITMGRQRGQLTTADLRANLPVETMSTEDIALIVIHLEESGVAVELEEDLLFPQQKFQPPRRESAKIIPFPGPAAKSERSKKTPAPLTALTHAPAQTAEPQHYPNRLIHWIVAAAGLMALAVLALIVFASTT